MIENPRRVLLLRTLACGCALAAPSVARAATPVDEADETAVQLGYLNDTRKVDDRKFPKHTAQQRCVDCSFFQGAAGDDWAGCAMFGRKQVNAAGWCNAWVMKP